MLAGICAGHGTLMLNSPLVLVPERLEEGKEWTGSAKVEGKEEIEIKVAGSSATQEITVPAGRFKTRAVEIIFIMGPEKRAVLKLWLAQGLGIVRYHGGVVNVPEVGRGEWELVETRWGKAEDK